MQTDPTQPGMSFDGHPRIDQIRDASPEVRAHVETCQRCSMVSHSLFGTLDLPKDLVTEAAFRWPGDHLAKGGMAVIFEGEDRRLGRKVILKTPRDADEVSENVARMFQQRVAAEARILAKLAHPSIVTIYELGRATTGSPFCVLEKVEGRSLRDRLDELAVDEAADGAPRTRERLELLASLVAIAEAMAYAHERRVVHRDITPNNILLGRRNEATLIDWGIARDLDAPATFEIPGLVDEAPSTSGRWATINAGTPPYVPFEQTQGKQAEPSFDVYSFGVTLYEVVSGKTPFAWKPSLDPTERHAQLVQFITWLQAAEPIAPAVPRDPELSGIIARAMAHDARDRFTADELVRALKQYLTGDLVFSHRYSRIGRLARWARRHRAVAAAVMVALVAVVGTAVVWAQLARQRQEKAELAAIAASARVDAADKEKAAAAAAKEAEEALARAAEAERQGKDARELKEAADKKRRDAEKTRAEAEAAAKAAKGDADDAIARWRTAIAAQATAEKLRDEAKTAELAALAERDIARGARKEAEAERDGANAARDAARRAETAALAAEADAKKARDEARTAQSRAEDERDAARRDKSRAEEDRAAAVTARERAERERDELAAKVAAAERALAEAGRRLDECEQRCGGGGSGSPPPPPSP
jgi:tRNA A-37 threonylcarbamoyl transferase component Bud32